MRITHALFIANVASLFAIGPAAAAPPATCKSSADTGCFYGQIFVLDGGLPNVGAADGSKLIGEKGAVGRSTADVKPGADAVATFLAALGERGVALTPTDEVVLFTAEFNAPGWEPTFYRDAGANRVAGIGLPAAAPTRPFVGWITAGSTATFFDDAAKLDKHACAAASACTPGFYTPFDALAQVTANLYGPYLTGANASVTKAGDKTHPQWSAWLDMRSSPLGGNYWRDNGNGTVESSSGIPAVVGAGGPYEGKGLLRFEPLDLYVLGFMAKDELLSARKITSYGAVTPAQVLKPAAQTFGKDVGPEMGRKAGVQVPGAMGTPVSYEDIVGAEARTPAFADAPHFVKQVWVVVADPAVDAAKRAAAIEKLERVRQLWNAYFYMATDYRGRVLTTFDGADDLAYFHFGQPAEEGTNGAYGYAGFGQVELVKAGVVPGLESGESFVRLETPGDTGVVRLGGWKQAKLAAAGGTANPPNAAVVRVRTTASKARGWIGVPGAEPVAIPEGKDSYLIGDGRWHVYSVALKDRLDLAAADAVAFIPSDRAASVDVDYVRLLYTAKTAESDEGCKLTADGKKSLQPDGFLDELDNCPKVYNPDQQDLDGNGVGDACEDFDGDTVVNACDNCLTVNNFRQQDSNKDGTGDLCEPDSAGRGCFLDPYSVGGAGDFRLGGLGVLLAFAVVFRLGSRRPARGKQGRQVR